MRHRPPWHGLRARLVLLVAFTLLPVAALTIALSHEQSALVEAQRQAETRRLVEHAAADQQRILDGTRALLAVLAETTAIRTRAPEQCDRLLRALFTRHEGYSNLGVADPSGTVVCSATPLPGPVNVADREWFQRTLATGDLAVGEYQIGRISGRPNVVASYPVFGPDGEIVAVVYAGHTLDWLRHFLQSGELPAGAVLSVVDGGGTVLATVPDADGAGHQLPPAVVEAMRAASSGRVQVDTFGTAARQYVFTALRAVGGPAHVVLDLPAHHWLAGPPLLGRVLVGLLAIALAAAAAAWIAGGWLLLRRLERLRQVAMLMRIGHLDLRAGPSRGQDELDDVIDAFDAMAAALAQREAQLQATATVLEEQVAIRTAELTASNRELTQALARRARTEAARAQLAAIVESSEDAIIGVDLDAVITSWNRGAERLYGYRADEAVGQSIHLLPSVVATTWEARLAALQRGERIEPFEAISTRRDGTQLHVSVVISPVVDAQGVLVGAAAIHRDISAQKQAEEARRQLLREEIARAQAEEAERRVRAVLESITDAFFAVDTDLRFTYVNRRAEQLLGRPREQLMGQHLWEVLPVPPESRFYRECREALATGRTAECTIFYAPLTCWWEIRIYPTPTGLAVYLQDVTERERAEHERAALTAALAQERATLLSVMASMSEGLLVLDSARRIRYCNVCAAELLGITPEEAVGQEVEQVFTPVWANCVSAELSKQAWANALQQSETRPQVELALAGPVRRELVVQFFSVTPASEEAAEIGLVLRDVTREREAQRTKDELMSVVSHELRTPLASLVGFAELLLTNEYPEAQRREFLSIMLREGQRLTALINDFLDLQRIDSGRQVLNVTLVDLALLLEEAVVAAGEDPERPIRLVLDAPLPAVRADPDRIRQVLANLLSNARKYSPNGGDITVAARRCDEGVAVTVADQGIGIPPEALPHLFEPFYRVDNSDRRAITGTGLGLAICRKIVQEHGGRIWAESAGPGQGTSMTFTLPAVEQAAGCGEVLIVEDDAAFAELLAAELAAAGLSSMRVGTAEHALELLGVARPRVVLLDLKLPALQGDVLLRYMREIEHMEVPVIVVTHLDVSTEERRLLEKYGVVTILRKAPGVASAAALATLGTLGLSPRGKGGPSDGDDSRCGRPAEHASTDPRNP